MPFQGRCSLLHLLAALPSLLPFSPGTDGRILGGCQVDADFFEFPYHVTLGNSEEGRVKAVFCGGTLISLSLVLTAAHCLVAPRETASTTAFSGLLNGSLANHDELTRQVRQVKEWHRHEKFDASANGSPEWRDFNVGLVFLEDEFEPVGARAIPAYPYTAYSGAFRQGLRQRDLHVAGLGRTPSTGISLISAVVRLVPRNMEPESQKLLDYFESRDRKGAKCDMVTGGGVVLRDRTQPVDYVVVAVITKMDKDIHGGSYSVGVNVVDHHFWIWQKSGVHVASPEAASGGGPAAGDLPRLVELVATISVQFPR